MTTPRQKPSTKPKAKKSTPKPRYRYQGMGFLRDISRAVDEATKETRAPREERAA